MGGGGGAKDLAKEANFIGVADFDLDLVIVVFEMASLKEALRVLGVDIGNVFLAGVVSPLDEVSWSSSPVCGAFAGDNLGLLSTLS